MTSTVIEADQTWMGTTFEQGVRIAVNSDGKIETVHSGNEPGPKTTERLRNRAIMPGFINVHSHAFQRNLRGEGDTFPANRIGPGGDFWTWREAMYALVERLDAESIYDISLKCFREMLAAGMTTVGEFHYVHHDATGTGFALDSAVVNAAKDAGIRLALLQTYYRTGGIGKPLSGGQKRFAVHTTTDYWKQFDRLASGMDGKTQSMGVVAHSIRAASIEEIEELHAESRQRGLVFHIHVEEVLGEIADCVAAYSRRPMRLYLERLEIDQRFTAVHCTHTTSEDLQEFALRGGTMCLCPLTEGNLGDGIPKLPAFTARDGRVAIGTDLNSRHDVFEELRWIEYVQRLNSQSRGVLRDEQGRVAPALLAFAHQNGARSLGLSAGAIAPGMHADFVEIDLSTRAMDGWQATSLGERLVFGAGDAEIAATWVGGQRVYSAA